MHSYVWKSYGPCKITHDHIQYSRILNIMFGSVQEDPFPNMLGPKYLNPLNFYF